MLRKILYLICFALCLILVPENKINADSQLDNYQWNKITEYRTGRDIYGISYNGKIFVAVGQKGLILWSKDGLAWNGAEVAYEEDFCKIEWNGSSFIATARSGCKFIEDNEHKLSLTPDKNEPVPPVPLSSAETNSISTCKLYGFAEGDKFAITVGESGNIFYGTKKGQKPLDNKLIFDEDSSYYREYVKRLGNSTVLHIGSSSLYTDNNLSEKTMPAPYIQTINKQKIIYIPAENVIRAIGGKINYDEKTSKMELNIYKSNIQLTLGSDTIDINGKQAKISYPAVLKNGQVYIPIYIFELLGKKVFDNNNLIVLSDAENIFDFDYDEEVLEALTQVFSNPKYQEQSLSESVVNVLMKLGAQRYDEGEIDESERYLLCSLDVEPNSTIYAYLLRYIRSYTDIRLSSTDSIDYNNCSVTFQKAEKYFENGLHWNCENTDLYTGMMYIYCDICWYEKAEECLNKAISLTSNRTGFDEEISYLKKVKGLDEPVKEIAVSNYNEFVNAIGSNRIIRVLPGNYSLGGSNDEEKGIFSVKNLTITGVPGVGTKYIDLKDASDLFDFINCFNVSVSNLELKNSFDANNGSNISINNCRIYHGLHIGNVQNMECKNTYIEGIKDDGTYEDSIVEIGSSEHVNFDGCTMKGYTLIIGYSYDNAISDINISNSNLINKAGICSTWSKYVPIKDDCGYEIFTGTEGWNEGRFLAAIKYTNNKGFDINYQNTYDGNEEIFNDGKFMKLAEKLDKLTNGNAFPSIDYIVGDDADWNAYYDYYGTPKHKKLNINFNVKDLRNPNQDNMRELIAQLKPLENDILAYDWPVTVVLTDAENPYWIVATAEFSSKSFEEFFNNVNHQSLENYCTIMFADEAGILADEDITTGDFFNVDVKLTEKEVSMQIEDKFLTGSLNVKPNKYYGQINSIHFTIRNKEGIHYITPIESFTGQGDFMHYDTDIIIKTDALTGEQYVLAYNTTYKLAAADLQETCSKYRDQIFNQLTKDKDLSEKLIGSPCKDVLLFIESDHMDKEIKFVFLAAHDNGTEAEYDYAEYGFEYYIGTFDVKNNKVTGVSAIDLIDFEDLIKND